MRHNIFRTVVVIFTLAVAAVALIVAFSGKANAENTEGCTDTTNYVTQAEVGKVVRGMTRARASRILDHSGVVVARVTNEMIVRYDACAQDGYASFTFRKRDGQWVRTVKTIDGI